MGGICKILCLRQSFTIANMKLAYRLHGERDAMIGVREMHMLGKPRGA